MAWLIGPVIRYFDTPSLTITWHHTMTATLPRPDDTNDPTTGATKATMPRIETGTGTIAISVGDDTKSTIFRSWRELTHQGQNTV